MQAHPLASRPLRAARALAAAGALSSLLLGCFAPAELPGPAAPTREVPAVGANLAPAAPGRQWVVLDTPGDVARVATVSGTLTGTTARGNEITGEATRDLCVTPCVVDLRQGLHTLVFTSSNNPDRRDRLEVQLQGDPLVVRHAIEQTPPRGATNVMWLAGLGVMVLGATTLGIGAPRDNVSLERVGAASLGIGGALVVGGILLSYFERGTHVPGATTQWTLPHSGGPTAAVSPANGALGLQF